MPCEGMHIERLSCPDVTDWCMVSVQSGQETMKLKHPTHAVDGNYSALYTMPHALCVCVCVAQ